MVWLEYVILAFQLSPNSRDNEDLKPSYVTPLAFSSSIAFASINVAPERSAPAWKPALNDATGRPLSLIVPAVLYRPDSETFLFPATWSIYPPFLSL